jgi:predicted metal-dependent hydrolase
MKRILFIFAALLLVFLCIPAPVYADTGTYQIDNYTVTLTPKPDGSVDITYYQQWTCLSGNIPWVTVGLPNRSYTITGSGNNVRSIRDDSGSGWYGVYIGLDKTYYANQSFSVSFTVNQKNLLDRKSDSWGINFTAGWYDNANIGKMDIILISPIDPSEYSYSLSPTSVIGNTMTWEKTNLPDGYRFNVYVSSKNGGFLTAVAGMPSQTIVATVSGIPTTSTPVRQFSGYVVFLIVVVVVIILLLMIAAIRRMNNKSAYSSPEVSPIANKKYFESQDSLEEQKKKLQENEDKVNEYIISEKDKITDDEKAKKINDFATTHNLFLNGNNYIDDYGNSYNNNMLWMLIMMNSMQAHNVAISRANAGFLGRSGFNNSPPPPFMNTPSCACACVACACACACACAGGGAAGCTVKLKNIKSGNSND